LNCICFRSVSKSFDDEIVLKDFNMEVGTGETKIILGGSGSGKSTILKMVLGLVRPDEGKILVNDIDITELEEDELMPIRSQIGMVFQEGALFDSLTVGENVAYRLREQGSLGEQEIRSTVEEMLGFVGLEQAIDKVPAELSGGMRRRVAIARAMVGQPRMMLYDEPTAGLDPITSRTICELVMKLRDIETVTSIFVTHDLKAAMTMASETAVKTADGTVMFESKDVDAPSHTFFVMLGEGKVLLEGTGQVMKASENEFIREFLD
jgi:phospholipid/cholesterol/gamma-HCH transport system ATP-binding protein